MKTSFSNIFAITKYEIKRNIRKPSFAIFIGVLIFISLMNLIRKLTGVQIGDTDFPSYSDINIFNFILLLYLYIFIAPFFYSGHWIKKDLEKNILPFFFSKPLKNNEYIWGKIMASTIVLYIGAVVFLFGSIFSQLITIQNISNLRLTLYFLSFFLVFPITAFFSSSLSSICITLIRRAKIVYTSVMIYCFILLPFIFFFKNKFLLYLDMSGLAILTKGSLIKGNFEFSYSQINHIILNRMGCFLLSLIMIYLLIKRFTTIKKDYL